MRFRMVADIEFDADDVDDAFLALSDHFTMLRHNQESDLIEVGSISIEPTGGKTP